jgi:ABC-2 type transport system permease protein
MIIGAPIAVAQRELASAFRQPAGWIIVGLFALLTSATFVITSLAPGAPATLRDLFSVSAWLLLPVAPAVTMRSLAEEMRSGTLELTTTSPLGRWGLVLGKYVGACAFLVVMLLPTLVLAGTLAAISDPAPDLGPIVAGYLCVLLLGAFYLAVGMLASSVTTNATLAFLITLFVLLALLFAPSAARFSPDWLRPALTDYSLAVRVGDFSRGIIDTSHIVFFLSASAWLVVVACVVMELRRWR